MPNNLPAKLANLTFGGFDCQRSDLSLHLDIVRGLNDGLSVRGKDTVVPTLAGRIPRNRVADTRDLLLAGLIQGEGDTEAERLASYQALRDAVEAAFSHTAAPATLEGVALDGSTRSITARALSIVWNPTDAFGVEELSIALESTDPNWQVEAAS